MSADSLGGEHEGALETAKPQGVTRKEQVPESQSPADTFPLPPKEPGSRRG